MGKLMGSPQRTWGIRSYVVGLATYLLLPDGADWRQEADGDLFYIGGGVRQGCVLSPRLFLCVLESNPEPLDAGVGKLARLAGIFRMACAHSWIWGLRTISFFLRKGVGKQNYFVGRTGDMFGRSWVTIECAKNEGLANSGTKSDRDASSKWTGNWGVRPWLYS